MLHARALHLQGHLESARELLVEAIEQDMADAESFTEAVMDVHIPEVCMRTPRQRACARVNLKPYSGDLSFVQS